jgi:hypothetical protein
VINLICDEASWMELLKSIPVSERTSEPFTYDAKLLRECGRPMLVFLRPGGTPPSRTVPIMAHIYPPRARSEGG